MHRLICSNVEQQREDAMSFTRLIVIASILITAPIRASADNLSLGGHMLGEKLSEFKRAFPSAVCGSPLHRPEATNNSDIADKTQLLGCCLDDPKQISTFSSWVVLSVAHCHVFCDVLPTTFTRAKVRS
jgi:hypothetical protein